MLQPRRVKHRKIMRGRMTGMAKGGTAVSFGSDAHDPLRRFRARSDFRNRQRGSVRRQNRVRSRQLAKLLENLFLQIHFLHRRLDDQINVAQRRFGRARENAVQTGAGFKFRDQMPFHALLVELSHTGHSFGDLLRVDVTQNHGQAARAEPLCDACAHHACADDRGAVNGLGNCRCWAKDIAPFPGTLLHEENSDEVMAFLGPGQFKHGFSFQRQRLCRRTGKAPGDDFQRFEHGRIMPARFLQ